MEQVVYTFRGEKYTNCYVAFKSDFVFSSITNIQNMLKSTNAGAKHAYIIRKH